MILRSCPDVRSLRSLVQASPSYHALYAARREQIFTTVTLQTLNQRHVHVLQPMHWVTVWLKGPKTRASYEKVKQTIESCIQQVRQGMRTICLTIEQCQALLTIQSTMRWWYDENPSVNGTKIEDSDEYLNFCAVIRKRDWEVHSGIITVNGWPIPEWIQAQREMRRQGVHSGYDPFVGVTLL